MKLNLATKIVGVALFSGAALLFSGCTTAPASQEGRADLTDEATAAINKFERTDPGLPDFLSRAYGYAIFPSVGEGAFGVGGSYGRGVVYEHGQKVGYCDITQASIGFQIGGEVYSELLVFQNKAVLDNFKANTFGFNGQASAVALTAGASAQAGFDNGVAVFTQSLKGLMYKAAIAGQKFSYTPLQQ